MTHRISLNTSFTRFDLASLIEEWVGFLETACNYEKADPALVAALAAEHAGIFREFVINEGMDWDDLTGDFLVPQALWARMVVTGGFPYSREAIDLVWADCFTEVNEERFEYIEEQVHLERQHGLV